jgi:hypothetical protein
MSVDCRKEIMITKEQQIMVNKLQELIGGSEAVVFRIALVMLYQKLNNKKE